MDTMLKVQKEKHHPALLATLIVAIVAAVLFGVVIILGSMARSNKTYFPNVMNGDKYYAVFLDNGQVYFGHLSKYFTSKNPVLSDIYYLQSTENLQSGEQKDEEQKTEMNLVKLGNELHGPADAMAINKDHILFVEELKTDGQVAKAITEHKKGTK